jgi:hypothetical protein
LVLPRLSLGVRAPNLLGGVHLPVGEVEPGHTKVVAFDCYGALVDPANVEIFALPEPEPETRGEYWDFGEPK